MSSVPIPPSAITAEEALADLAGAMLVVAELLIDEGKRKPARPWSLILFVALRQWQDSGFCTREAHAVADRIAESYVSHYG